MVDQDRSADAVDVENLVQQPRRVWRHVIITCCFICGIMVSITTNKSIRRTSYLQSSSNAGSVEAADADDSQWACQQQVGARHWDEEGDKDDAGFDGDLNYGKPQKDPGHPIAEPYYPDGDEEGTDENGLHGGVKYRGVDNKYFFVHDAPTCKPQDGLAQLDEHECRNEFMHAINNGGTDALDRIPLFRNQPHYYKFAKGKWCFKNKIDSDDFPYGCIAHRTVRFNTFMDNPANPPEPKPFYDADGASAYEHAIYGNGKRMCNRYHKGTRDGKDDKSCICKHIKYHFMYEYASCEEGGFLPVTKLDCITDVVDSLNHGRTDGMTMVNNFRHMKKKHNFLFPRRGQPGYFTFSADEHEFSGPHGCQVARGKGLNVVWNENQPGNKEMKAKGAHEEDKDAYAKYNFQWFDEFDEHDPWDCRRYRMPAMVGQSKVSCLCKVGCMDVAGWWIFNKEHRHVEITQSGCNLKIGEYTGYISGTILSINDLHLAGRLQFSTVTFDHGWTLVKDEFYYRKLVMKISGGGMLGYSSPYWTNGEVLNPDSHEEDIEDSKTAHFNNEQFNMIMMCVGHSRGNCVAYKFDYKWLSARHLFSAGYIEAHLNQTGILGAFGPKRNSYSHCPMHKPGFNVECSGGNKARWGYCASCPAQDCQTDVNYDADAAIGLGLDGQGDHELGAGWTRYFATGENTCSGNSRTEKNVWIWVEMLAEGAKCP